MMESVLANKQDSLPHVDCMLKLGCSPGTFWTPYAVDISKCPCLLNSMEVTTVMAPDGGKHDTGNCPTNIEAVEDVDVPEWLQILEDEAAVLFAEEDEETGGFAEVTMMA
jgi:hypothetical protein